MLAAQVRLALPDAAAAGRAARCRSAGPAREVPATMLSRAQRAPDASNHTRDTCSNTTNTSLRSSILQHTQHTQHTFPDWVTAGMAGLGHTHAHTSAAAGAASSTAGSRTHFSIDEGMDGTPAAAAAAATAAHAARLTALLTIVSRSIDSRRLSRCATAQHGRNQRSSARPNAAWLSPSSPGSLCDWRSPARPGTMAGAWQARRHASGPAPLRSARPASPCIPNPYGCTDCHLWHGMKPNRYHVCRNET